MTEYYFGRPVFKYSVFWLWSYVPASKFPKNQKLDPNSEKNLSVGLSPVIPVILAHGWCIKVAVMIHLVIGEKSRPGAILTKMSKVKWVPNFSTTGHPTDPSPGNVLSSYPRVMLPF